MKNIAIALLLFSGCGSSACADYGTAYCQKAQTCGYSVDGVIIRPALDRCKKDFADAVSAAHYTEAQCTTYKQQVSGWSCPQFQAVATGGKAQGTARGLPNTVNFDDSEQSPASDGE